MTERKIAFGETGTCSLPFFFGVSTRFKGLGRTLPTGMERGAIYTQRYNDETLAMKILTASEMREVDRLTTERYGIPSLSLMENAGKSIADFMSARFRRLESRRIIVLCGKGNNGGDGFVTARHLA